MSAEVEIRFCVNHCATPCPCSYCSLMSVPLHEPIPSEAGPGGQLCLRCITRLESMIGTVSRLHVDLDYGLVKRGDTEGGGGERVKGSPALINLDAYALLDSRTMYEPIRRDDGSISSGPIHIWAAIRGWASSLRDAIAGDGINSGDCSGDSWFLLDHFEVLIRMPWVGDCFEEYADMQRLLSRASGIEGKRPIGRCVTTWPAHWLRKERTEPCNHPVFAESGAVLAMCGRCGTRYRGMDLIRMKLQQKGIE